MFRWLASSPKIYVVERQSPDWAALDDRYFDEMRAFARLIGRPENMMVDYVRLWDDTFPLSFFQVRARLKEIAMGSRADMRGVERIDLAGAATLDAPGAWLVFSDDDDWFAPDLADRLRTETGRGDEVVIWRSLVLRDGFERRAVDHYCYTNNYGVRGRLAAIHCDRFECVAQHWLAQDTISRLAPPTRFIDQPLSVTNRHPASTLELERGLGDRLDGARLRAMVADWMAKTGRADLATVPWTERHIGALRQVFQRLLEEGERR